MQHLTDEVTVICSGLRGILRLAQEPCEAVETVLLSCGRAVNDPAVPVRNHESHFKRL